MDAEKCPNLIAKAGKGGSNTYKLLKRLWKLDPVPVEKRASTPLFRAAGSKRFSHKAINKQRFVRLCKLIAKACGIPVAWVAGHSARIGGATDLMAAMKSGCSAQLKGRGRWASDVADIYARLTRKAMLQASRLMHKGKGRSLEEIYPTFTQPACNTRT